MSGYSQGPPPPCSYAIDLLNTTLKLYVACDRQAAEFLLMKVNLENSWAPNPWFEPFTFSTAGWDNTSRLPNMFFLWSQCDTTEEWTSSFELKVQLEAKVFNPPDIFPLISIVNKSCNIERCVNSMLQIIKNMMVSQCSELEQSMFGGTTLSGQRPLIYVWV